MWGTIIFTLCVSHIEAVFRKVWSHSRQKCNFTEKYKFLKILIFWKKELKIMFLTPNFYFCLSKTLEMWYQIVELLIPYDMTPYSYYYEHLNWFYAIKGIFSQNGGHFGRHLGFWKMYIDTDLTPKFIRSVLIFRAILEQNFD